MATTNPTSSLPADTSHQRLADSDGTTAPPSFPPLGQRVDAAPGVARSAIPVVVSVVMLFGLAVGVAFAGRSLLEMLSGLMAP